MDFKRIGDYFVKDEVARNKIAEEIQNRMTAITNAVNDIKTYISNLILDETSSRNTAIKNAINEEVTNRDNAITDAINKEAQDRNTSITNAINGEAEDRNTELLKKVDKTRFYVLEGEQTIESPTGTLTQISVDYPEGFTIDNCTVLSASRFTSNTWVGARYNSMGEGGTPQLDCGWTLSSPNIKLHVGNYSAGNPLVVRYRIVLMKLADE